MQLGWRLRALGLLALAVFASALPATVAAHGEAPDVPPDLVGLALGWTIEPLVLLGLAAAAAGWLVLVRRVDRAHPEHRVPASRSRAFLAGLAAIAVALLSGIGRYDTTLFSVHMVQHILLTLVAAPLLVLGAPITLLLRVSSPETRRRTILPILESRFVRFVGHPVTAWLAFTAVMWGSHFSALFDLALEDPLAHEAEHLLFLASGILFWWPVVGLDPSPFRMGHAARVLYAFLQMPQNSFLAVAILYAGAPLYPHYATIQTSWPIDPLADQQLAGGIMWLAGDALFLVAVIGLIAAWMRHDERESAAADRRADAALAVIHEREARLRERRASDGERGSE